MNSCLRFNTRWKYHNTNQFCNYIGKAYTKICCFQNVEIKKKPQAYTTWTCTPRGSGGQGKWSTTTLHCIAGIHVVYLKEVDLLAFSCYNPLPMEPPFFSVHREKMEDWCQQFITEGLTESGSLTNTNIIEKSCLFCILSPVPLLLRALRNRSDHIDIPSTQHRSLKGSRRPTKVSRFLFQKLL